MVFISDRLHLPEFFNVSCLTYIHTLPHLLTKLNVGVSSCLIHHCVEAAEWGTFIAFVCGWLSLCGFGKRKSEITLLRVCRNRRGL